MLKKPQNIYLPIDKFQAKVFKHKTDEKRGEWVSNFALALSEEENDDFAKALLEDSQYKMYKEIIRQWRFKVKQSFGKDGVKNPTEKQIYDKCVEEYGIEFVEADELISRKDKRKSATTKNKHNGDASTGDGEDESTTVSSNLPSNPLTESPRSGAKSGNTSTCNTSTESPRSGSNGGKNLTGADAVDGDTTDDKSDTSAPTNYYQDADNTDEKHNDRGAGSATREGAEAKPSGDSRAAWASGQPAPRTFKGHKFKAPTKEELYAYAQDNGLDESDARDCWEMCESRQWADRDGVQIENWKTFVKGFCKSRQAKRSA